MAPQPEMSPQAQGVPSAHPPAIPGTAQATTTTTSRTINSANPSPTAQVTTIPPAASTTTQQPAQPTRPTQTPRPLQPAQKPPPPQRLRFPLEYVPAYTGPKKQAASSKQPKTATNKQPAERNQHGGFNSTATTATTSKHYANRISKEKDDERRKNYYNILSDMDPYKGSPKEFIHLLVMAAMRDEEISKAICRMNEERIKNPSSWQPVRPHGLSTLGGQSRPQQNQPLPLANGHVQQQAMATGSPGSGPQQPPISQTVVYYVYPPPQPNLPHQVIPGPVYGAPTPNMYPPFLPPQLPPGVGTPPQHMAPYAAGALPGQAGVPVTHTVPNAPYPPVPPQPMSQQPSAQQPIPPAKDNASSRRSANGARQSNSSNNALANGGVALDTNANSNRPTNRNGGANDDSRPGNDGGSNMNGSTDTSDSDIELEDQPSGNKEQSCNFTWVVDRAETQLGWTGNWDKESDIRQDTIGQSTAFKLQKLLKRMGAMFDRYLDFSNRVHILTVMREVIIATLDTDSRVGRRCRENAKEYDDTFVEAVSKLIPAHKKDLKALEGGKWMEEMKLLIKEADRQSLFPRLVEVLALLEA